MKYKKIYDRYFRKVGKYPKGAIIHHGDCDIFSVHICTCGLLHDLKILLYEDRQKLYKNYSKDIDGQWIAEDALGRLIDTLDFKVQKGVQKKAENLMLKLFGKQYKKMRGK